LFLIIQNFYVDKAIANEIQGFDSEYSEENMQEVIEVLRNTTPEKREILGKIGVLKKIEDCDCTSFPWIEECNPECFKEVSSKISLNTLKNILKENTALIAYISSSGFTGSPFRNKNGSLTNAQKRGWKLFHDKKVGCIECHPGDAKNPLALFSDAQTHDVGTGRIGKDGFRTTPGDVSNTKVPESDVDPYSEEYDVPIIGLDLVKEFETPTLRDIYASDTYFHDGSAQTLMGTIDNTSTKQDMHGITSHLSNQELQDLVEFMKAL
jgi:hypothetical protein